MSSAKSFFVPFVLWYLRISARIQLRKIKPLVIGVGGSAGKTSLVAALHAAIAPTRRVRSGGGVNSETGIPLGILGIKMRSYGPADWFRVMLKAKWAVLTDWQKYDVYIAELGIDGPNEPKNMDYMLKIVTPTVGVLTNIALEHSEFFEAAIAAPPDTDPSARATAILDRIAAEEEKLLTRLSPNATAVVNIDDSRITTAQSRIHAKQVTVSTTRPDANFSVRSVNMTLESFYMEVVYGGRTHDLRLPRPLSRAYVSTLLLAVATAHAAGVGITDALRGITEEWQLPPGRLSIFKGVNGSTLIDSSYNATPLAMEDALAFLRDAGKGRRRVAVLGDMRELGKTGEAAHAALAPLIRETTDHAILIGPQMEQFCAPRLRELGASFETFPTFTAARDAIRAAVEISGASAVHTKPSVVLVKGSQNTLFLERAVQMLLADPADAAKLCRRGAMWDGLRASVQ